MQDALDSHRALDQSEENYIAAHRRHAQARGQVRAAGVTHRGTSDMLTLLHQLADETPGIGAAVLGNVVADVVAEVEKVLPRLR